MLGMCRKYSPGKNLGDYFCEQLTLKLEKPYCLPDKANAKSESQDDHRVQRGSIWFIMAHGPNLVLVPLQRGRDMTNYQSYIRNIPDFPKPGIVFKNITTLLADATILHRAVEELFEDVGSDIVVGIESRIFIFGLGVARHRNRGFAPVRKPCILPYKTYRVSYEFEYGMVILEIHVDAVEPGHRIQIVDHLLATRGTASLIRKVCGENVCFGMLIELGFLNGRKTLGDARFHALLKY